MIFIRGKTKYEKLSNNNFSVALSERGLVMRYKGQLELWSTTDTDLSSHEFYLVAESGVEYDYPYPYVILLCVDTRGGFYHYSLPDKMDFETAKKYLQDMEAK